jgi:uncharacterized protein
MNTRPLALVTGASSGIGAEIAQVLAQRGHDLVLVARTESALASVAAEVKKHGASATVVSADLAAPHAGHQLSADLRARGLHIDVLVNNAGFADFGPFHTADADKIDRMISLNIATLTELMRDLVPDMVQRKTGRVLNVASTAAFMPGPLMATYYATKAYVLSISEATHEELKGTGVTVTALCPGPTASGFQAAAAMEDSKLVRGRKIMSAHTVAQQGVKALLAGKPVVVTGFKNKIQALSPRVMPRRFVPGVVRRAQAAH